MPKDNFADNSWENIIWACQTGNVPDTWTVGSQKLMTINGRNYYIDIIGLRHDDYADGSGKAPVTFQMHECYATQYVWHGTSASTINIWETSDMRTTHLPALLALMPAEVKTAIREVNKPTSAGNKSTAINTNAEKLFLLSEIEVHGSAVYSVSGEGEQYAYYANDNNNIEKRQVQYSFNAVWWTRSPYKDNYYNVCRIGTKDIFNYGGAYGAQSIAFAFCF